MSTEYGFITSVPGQLAVIIMMMFLRPHNKRYKKLNVVHYLKISLRERCDQSFNIFIK